METRPTTNEVWSTLHADLRRFIRRRVSDDHQTDDLLQETFVRIHSRLGTLRGEDRLAPWVYRIARNVIHDHHRTGTTRALPILNEPSNREMERSVRLRDRATQWLGEMIDQLPETFREPVRMSEIDGLTQLQVAERLGLSLSATKSRVQRGRLLLRAIMDQCCTFEFDRQGNLMDCDPKPNRAVCRNCDIGDELDP